MSKEYSIDPLVWFSEREMKFTPRHFVTAKSPLTIDSKTWILKSLRGRFSLSETSSGFEWVGNDSFLNVYPSFEDPKEAVMYELMWSS